MKASPLTTLLAQGIWLGGTPLSAVVGHRVSLTAHTAKDADLKISSSLLDIFLAGQPCSGLCKGCLAVKAGTLSVLMLLG